MSDKKVWFGTDHHMAWIPAPAVGIERTVEKFRQSGQYINGGAYSLASAAGAQRISLTWNPMSGEDVGLIRGFLEGQYGPGPFHLVDPFLKNVLPPYLSMPYLNTTEYQAPGLRPVRGQLGERELAGNTVNGHPPYQARYMEPGTGGGGPFYEVTEWNLHIPPGYTMFFGASGQWLTNHTAGMLAFNSAYAAPVPPESSMRFNEQVPSGPDGRTVSVKLAQSTESDVVVRSIMASLLPTGTAPQNGPFIPGTGFGGLELASDIQVTSYSSALNLEAISAEFIEVAPWA